jgi:hypothetical protein
VLVNTVENLQGILSASSHFDVIVRLVESIHLLIFEGVGESLEMVLLLEVIGQKLKAVGFANFQPGLAKVFEGGKG